MEQIWNNRIAQVEAPSSPLWSENVRNIVSNKMMSQHEINSRRSEQLVPGMAYLDRLGVVFGNCHSTASEKTRCCSSAASS